MNDLEKHHVFEDTSMRTPNKRTKILAKDLQYYSPQNEDAGDDICWKKHKLLKFVVRRHTDEPMDIILRELEELKKFNIQILKEVNLLKSGKFQVSLVKK